MEISGTIIQINDEQRGEGKNGTWRKKEFVIEYGDQYPKKVCMSIWGDKIDQFNFNTGSKVNVSINIESREYNGRWYTDVRAWKTEALAPPESQGPPSAPAEGSIPPYIENASEEDDLPF